MLYARKIAVWIISYLYCELWVILLGGQIVVVVNKTFLGLLI